jgi:nucleoside-diphosphate-sugar epimerase
LRALVTGGGGFIGSHLVERLLREGNAVRVLDNFATGHRRNLLPVAADVELVEGDIRNYERVHDAVSGCEAVFHQAALPSVPRSIRDPLPINTTNITGTLNVLLAARRTEVRRVVFGSSSSVYGKNPVLPNREDLTPLPLSPYAATKLAGESYCRSFAEVYGLETVSLRYFNVFGPRQDPRAEYAAVVPRFIAALLDGRAPTLYGDGETSRDFTYVDNVVEANLLAAHSPDCAGEAFNIGCGERVTLNQLLVELRRELQSDVSPAYDVERVGDMRHSLADLRRSHELLGYSPVVRFKEGLRRTIRFFRARHPHAAGRAVTGGAAARE